MLQRKHKRCLYRWFNECKRRNLKGVQLTSLLNVAGTQNKGLQLAALGNIAVDNRGMQLGITNYGEQNNGLQAGLANVSVKTAKVCNWVL